MAKIPPRPSGKGEPPASDFTLGNLDKTEEANVATMNFKVPESFKREFKIYAAQQNKSMNRVLQEAFRLYIASR